MNVRSIVDMEPEVEHNGTVPVWYLVHPREMKALTAGQLVNEFEVAAGGRAESRNRRSSAAFGGLKCSDCVGVMSISTPLG
jgi:hypothetical protein